MKSFWRKLIMTNVKELFKTAKTDISHYKYININEINEQIKHRPWFAV